ncbi:WXG100 family type VII secretion target [Micromonospora sp. NPDC003197]
MAQDRKIVDEASTADLVRAFAQANSDQATAQNAARSAQGDLAAGWQGQASQSFGNTLDEWLAGLTKVTAALESLSDNMVEFARQTATTEDDNIRLAQSNGASSGIAPSVATSASPVASWT